MEIRQAYLIERVLSEAELDGFRVLLRQAESHVYLTYPLESLQALGARLWPGLTAEDKKAADQELLQALYELGHQPLSKKHTLADRLSYRGFQTWYYHRFRINNTIRPRYHQFRAYRKLAESYATLTVYTHAQPQEFFLRQLGKVEFIVVKGVVQNTAQASFPLREQLKCMARRFWKGLYQQRQLKGTRPEHLFVLNNAHYKPILDPDALPGLYTDNMFAGYFLKAYSQHFVFVDKLLFEKGDAAAKGGVKQGDVDDKRLLLHNEWIEWTTFLNPLVLFRIWRFNRHLKKGYKSAYRKIKDPFYRYLLREVVKLHRSTLYFFGVFVAYRRFFRHNRFKSLTLLDEYSPNFRALVDAAKMEGVRTQAIQHGGLAAFNPGYTYLEKDARFSPWPDRLLVWGRHWQEFLTRKASYPEQAVIVTGQLRTDIIPALKATPLQPEQLLGEQTKGKYLILLATQPLADAAMRRQVALDTFKAAAALPDAWVLLKPHPRESDAAQYYPALAQEAGCQNYLLLPDFELYLALSLSHVLVHAYSIVGVEAVYFGLPAITMDYLQQDPLGYVAAGVALQATSAETLLKHLQALQQGKLLLSPEKQQAYIAHYAYAIDGKVAERTAQAIFADVLPS